MILISHFFRYISLCKLFTKFRTSQSFTTSASNLFDVGHRIRVDISSSNWPRLDVNPNTGEPIGRHTHTVPAEQAVYADAEHPSHVVLPVIPRPT